MVPDGMAVCVLVPDFDSPRLLLLSTSITPAVSATAAPATPAPINNWRLEIGERAALGVETGHSWFDCRTSNVGVRMGAHWVLPSGANFPDKPVSNSCASFKAVRGLSAGF